MTDFDRSQGIGASDAAAVLGISPWRSPWDVWAEKTHDPSYEPQAETEAMRWGTILEPVLIEEYERQTGRIVIDRQGLFQDGHVYCHLDGAIESADENTLGTYEGVVEVKTATRAKDWADGVPEYYQAQVYVCIELSDAKWADVAVLLPGGDFRIYRIEADPEVQAGIMTALEAFWTQHVMTGTPPPVDGSDGARRYLAGRYAGTEDALPDTDEIEPVVTRLAEVRALLKAAEAEEAFLENRAKSILGEYTAAEGIGWRLTWKRSKPFPTVKWKEAAGEMVTMMQLAGLAESAAAAIASHTEVVENRRPFVLKVEAAE